MRRNVFNMKSDRYPPPGGPAASAEAPSRPPGHICPVLPQRKLLTCLSFSPRMCASEHHFSFSRIRMRDPWDPWCRLWDWLVLFNMEGENGRVLSGALIDPEVWRHGFVVCTVGRREGVGARDGEGAGGLKKVSSGASIMAQQLTNP